MRLAPLAIAGSLIPHLASAYELERNTNGQITRWADPRVGYALAETSTIPSAAVRVAFDAWSQVPGAAYEGVWIGTATSGVGRVLVSEHGAEAAVLALTFNVTSTVGSILGSEIQLNTREHHFDGSPGSFDLTSVLTHEAGHSLGLAHTCGGAARSCFDLDDLSARERAKILGAVMAPTVSVGEERRVPNEDDRAGLVALYPGTRGAGPSMGEPMQDCAARGFRVEVARAVELSLRFEDGRVEPASVLTRSDDAAVLAPLDEVADLIARDPGSSGVASRVAAMGPLRCDDAGVVAEAGAPAVEDGGCSCTSGGGAVLFVGALRRRRR